MELDTPVLRAALQHASACHNFHAAVCIVALIC
jgi:hypothetical protein